MVNKVERCMNASALNRAHVFASGCANASANKCSNAFVDGRANMPVNSNFQAVRAQNLSLFLSEGLGERYVCSPVNTGEQDI